MAKPHNFEQYIAEFPAEVKAKLKELRHIILEVVPEAVECISYGMPAFKYKGMLVWIGAHTSHIGLYPRASVINVFASELTGYKTSKGTIQFPLDQPLPVELIQKIVLYRVKENEESFMLKLRSK